MTRIRIRTGRFSGTVDDTPDWPLYGGQGQRTHTEKIAFDAPFAAPPQVVAWMGLVDVIDGANRRLKLEVDGITAEGFELKVSTWADTQVRGCDATWIAHGEPAPAPEVKPAPEVEPEPEPEPEPEKLNRIEGIGPATMRALHEAGVRTYAQLAAKSPDDLRAILARAGSRFSLLDPTTWPEQAALAAAGDWDALKALQDRLDGGRRTD